MGKAPLQTLCWAGGYKIGKTIWNRPDVIWGEPENNVGAKREIQQLAFDPHDFHAVTKHMQLP